MTFKTEYTSRITYWFLAFLLKTTTFVCNVDTAFGKQERYCNLTTFGTRHLDTMQHTKMEIQAYIYIYQLYAKDML